MGWFVLVALAVGIGAGFWFDKKLTKIMGYRESPYYGFMFGLLTFMALIVIGAFIWSVAK